MYKIHLSFFFKPDHQCDQEKVHFYSVLSNTGALLINKYNIRCYNPIYFVQYK